MANSEGTWLGLPHRLKRLVQAGFLLGVGLGGFFDGIVFHQILQFHQMLSAHPDPSVAEDVHLNVLADGVFHLVTWLFTLAGVALLLSAWRKPEVPASGRALLGSGLMGWGAFNLVEGIINHFILGIHHVWPEGPGGRLFWDVAFLVWGAVFLVGGYLIIRGTAVGSDTDSRRDDRR